MATITAASQRVGDLFQRDPNQLMSRVVLGGSNEWAQQCLYRMAHQRDRIAGMSEAELAQRPNAVEALATIESQIASPPLGFTPLSLRVDDPGYRVGIFEPFLSERAARIATESAAFAKRFPFYAMAHEFGHDLATSDAPFLSEHFHNLAYDGMSLVISGDDVAAAFAHLNEAEGGSRNLSPKSCADIAGALSVPEEFRALNEDWGCLVGSLAALPDDTPINECNPDAYGWMADVAYPDSRDYRSVRPSASPSADNQHSLRHPKSHTPRAVENDSRGGPKRSQG